MSLISGTNSIEGSVLTGYAECSIDKRGVLVDQEDDLHDIQVGGPDESNLDDARLLNGT